MNIFRPDRGAYFPPVILSALEDARDRAIDFWAEYGIGSIGVDQFVFLEGRSKIPNEVREVVWKGDKSLPAKRWIRSADNLKPGYYLSLDRVIINPANVRWGLPEGEAHNSSVAVALARLLMGHETTHIVQERKGTYDTLSRVDGENEADYFAGVLVGRYYPEDIQIDQGIMDGMVLTSRIRDTHRIFFDRGVTDGQSMGRAGF
jgi:hypothetical protein